MNYEIKYEPFPVLVMDLNNGEEVQCQSGAMSWMSPNMEMQTSTGGGLGKLVLLRMAKKAGFDIGEDNVIRKIRFPLHDHCKKNLGWSNAQVLMRFTLLQLVVMPILLIVLIKVR